MLILHTRNPTSNESIDYLYDPTNNQLSIKETGQGFGNVIVKKPNIPHCSPDDPIIGKRRLSTVKIQMGLKCNYSCSYCVQKAMPHDFVANPEKVKEFLNELPNWYDGGIDGTGSETSFEFWGGEPFVYWKVLKPLAEGIREHYPNARFVVITNGSILTHEKVDWLKKLDFSLSVSHDGPYQATRGDDPLDNPEMVAIWKRLFIEFPGKFSINPILSHYTHSRKKIQDWFCEKFELGIADFVIGEGGFVVPYNEDSANIVDLNYKDFQSFAKQSFDDIFHNDLSNLAVVKNSVDMYFRAISGLVEAKNEWQKCGMDRPDKMAIDLEGNVITCQNVSADSVSSSGNSHKIGHISKLNEVKLNTATHFMKRDKCSNCPVLASCKGACMFNHGKMHELACDSSYFDNISYLAIAINRITGNILIYIDSEENDLPNERRDPFGFMDLPVTKKRKVIPISSI